MPRPKPSFDDHKHYFKDVIIDIPSTDTYNNNTKITIHCQNDKSHTYKLSVNQIKNQHKNPIICPHCENKKTKHIPKEIIKKYADKYNLDFFPKQDFYSRWGNDHITFVCNKCGYFFTIKSLAYWEKKQPPYICESCKSYNMIPETELSQIFDYILNKNTTTINDIVYKKILSKPITPGVMKILTSISNDWEMIEYNGTRKKATFICKTCGNKKNILPLNMRNKNTACRSCFLKSQRKSIENKLVEICKESSIYFEDGIDFSFEKTDAPISFICNKCGFHFHKTWAEITGMYYNLSCPTCNTKSTSKKETSIFEYIKSIYKGKIYRNDRNIIYPYELDIVLPDLNIAVEFCGNLWHCDKFIKDTQYHARKTKLCKEKSVRLITIFEDEWDDKQDICKSRLKSFFNLCTNVIYARKCTISVITKEEAKTFLDQNHIQGKCNFDVSIGLLYNNVIVSVMTFSTSTGNKTHDVELNRFAIKTNTSVVGGFSKLISYFIKQYDFSSIASFADLRWSEGDVYFKNGFTLTSEIRPRYFYVGNSTLWKRKHRFGFNKSKLVKKYGEKYSHMSENEITKALKIYRLYDCGYLKFVIQSKNNE